MAATKENNSEETNRPCDTKPVKKRGWPFWVVFLISAWMFFLGVLVGRGMFPLSFDINALEKKIAELKETSLKAEEMMVQKASPVSPDVKSELEFYEALKMNKQSEAMNLAAPKSGSPGQAESTIKPENRVKPETPLKTKAVPKPEKMSESTKSETKVAPPVFETRTSGEKPDKHYSIQVASLKDPQEADKLVEMFRKRGYPAYRASAEVRNTGVWHRVRIGPFPKQSEALRILGPISRESKGALIIEHSP